MIVARWRNVFVFAVITIATLAACARRPGPTLAPSAGDTAATPAPRGVAIPRAERTFPAMSSPSSAPSAVEARPGSGTHHAVAAPQTGLAARAQRAAAPGGEKIGAERPTGGLGAKSSASTSGTETRRSPAEFGETTALADVYFEFDRATIPPAGSKTLDANAAWINNHSDQLILIEGHCDDRGTNDYNLALGERRARATRNYLVARGVPATRITIVSYGEERPACREPSEACRAKNRRAHFLVRAQ